MNFKQIRWWIILFIFCALLTRWLMWGVAAAVVFFSGLTPQVCTPPALDVLNAIDVLMLSFLALWLGMKESDRHDNDANRTGNQDRDKELAEMGSEIPG